MEIEPTRIKASEVRIGDLVELDMGYGSHTDDVFLKVLSVHQYEFFSTCILFTVKHGGETIECSFTPDDLVTVKRKSP